MILQNFEPHKTLAKNSVFQVKYSLSFGAVFPLPKPLQEPPEKPVNMCGINGIAYTDSSGRRVDDAVLARMRDVQRHRGPDGEGLFVEGQVGLGHRRLSIVDVSAGAQPIFNEDDSLVIVFNGEIFNHSEQRAELVARGHNYKTSSDTETIVHLYEEFGGECVHRLRGMFAFAIWDKRKRELFIARDRLGKKPLYYFHDEKGNLFFGSEIKTILEAADFKPQINHSVLPDQFANHGSSGEETLFTGVKRLLPGHTMLWRDGKLTIKKYWDVAFEPKDENRKDADVVEEWKELFEESVRLRLMSDVPLGMFLSGGIDSSAIAAVMAKMVSEPIKTFSVAFNEKGANELEYARIVARKFGTDHHEITITSDDFFSALPDLVWHEDEPLGFSASVPLYFVSKLASEHVKVVLTGEGSDELLAGYGRYEKALSLLKYGRVYEGIVPPPIRRAVAASVNSLPPTFGKLKRTFLARPTNVTGLFFDNFSIFSSAMQSELFSNETKAKIGELDPYRHRLGSFDSAQATELLDRILHSDLKTYLHELLMKQDQMSMAASIESRVPFLDHKLVEFSARMPVRMKLRGGTTKWILREAMKGVLPEEILTRPKMGFPVPLGDWLRSAHRDVVDEYILGERPLARGIFNSDFVRRLATEHFAGVDHAERLFRLINFEIWMRRFID